MATKITREQIMSFLNVGSGNTVSWAIIGTGITDYGQSYNPQVETEKWIINKNATSSVESYQIQGTVSQKCYFGDAVYDYVNELRRNAKTGSACETEVLDIDTYDASGNSYKATKYKCSIAITSYATGENPVIEYTIYYNGDPEVGTATISDGTPTFTKSVPSV